MPKGSDERKTKAQNDIDWREITDAAERRRMQNRIAQRKYRRNIKLQQQGSDEMNDSFASPSPETVQQQSLRLQKIPSDSAPDSSLSTSLAKISVKGPSEPSSLCDFWDDMTGTSYLPDSPLNSEDLRGLSVTPSAQGGLMSTRGGSEVFDIAQWTDVEGCLSTIATASTRPPPLTALQKAILWGQGSAAKLLIENGGNVHVIDRDGNSLLHLAVQSGDSVSVLIVLRNGIDVNETNSLGHTALHLAIERDDLDVIKLLLGAGANIEMQS
ncbi:hypothetical protein E8E13_000213 [Curvularia kusanoi]|uniref:BZIP domain-containing protein n=1 Tax=Curvularia kusanoi TaxID=90978 RepID=A0A9P4TAW4_CURKU|nr:hypothetical protein E8E13_000213 [Curvularia kusanoi]